VPHRIFVGWLIAGVVLLAACGKKESPAPAQAPASVPASVPESAPQSSAPASIPASAAAAGVTLASVTLSKAGGAAKKPDAAAERFNQRDTVKASVDTEGAGAATLGVRWIQGSGAKGRTLAEQVASIAPTGATTTEFLLARPEGLAAGDYQVEILLDGNVVATRAFNVAPPLVAKPKSAAPPAAVQGMPDASVEQLVAASLVRYGDYECELGQTMTVAKSARHEGYVEVRAGGRRATLMPVLSSTGAVRLEEVNRGALLVVQIPAKSIVFDQKAGQRLIDGCRRAGEG